jgi:hypothetical protein
LQAIGFEDAVDERRERLFFLLAFVIWVHRAVACWSEI